MCTSRMHNRARMRAKKSSWIGSENPRSISRSPGKVFRGVDTAAPDTLRECLVVFPNGISVSTAFRPLAPELSDGV